MLSVYRTLSLRYLARRWFRALLIVASIALGVATLVATRALNATMTKAALASVNPMAGLADLVIANGELTISDELMPRLAKVPGVKAVKPRLFDNAVLPQLDNHPVLVVGLDRDELKDTGPTSKDISFSPDIPKNTVRALLTWQTPVVVGDELAKVLPAGERVLVKKNIVAADFPLMKVGTVSARGNAAALSGFVLILDRNDAARVLGYQPGQISRLDIVLDPAANRADVRKAIADVIGERGQVRTPEEQNDAFSSTTAGLQTGFSLCGLAALIVGLFLVYNSLAVSVAERRHEIGILLSLGATRDQILKLFAGEAALLGLCGAIVGIPLGIGLAYLGLQYVQDVLGVIFLSVNINTVEVSPQLIVLAMIAGIATAMIASTVPAIQASRENPAEAVRRTSKAHTAGHLLWDIVVSITMIAVGTGMILLRSRLPMMLGSYGGLTLVMIGGLVSSPVFAALAARLIQPIARRYLGIEWRLGADNLVRSPGRTGLVIGALAAGVALVLQTAGTIHSNRAAVRDWLEDHVAADLIVTSGGPIGAGGRTLPMSRELGDEFEKVPGILRALPIRARKVFFDETQILIMALEVPNALAVEKDRPHQKSASAAFQSLANQPGGVLISNNFTPLHGVKVGDFIKLSGPNGPVPLKVVGSFVDFNWNKGTVTMNRDDFVKVWGDTKVDVFNVYLRPGADALAAKQALLSTYGATHGLTVQTREELQAYVDSVIERVYGIAYAQQIVVMAVAGLGVVTALLISVLQRRREMGLLRAIGANRGQVIRTVLAEATLMGLIGTVIGLLVGVPLEWYILRVVILEEAGFLFPLRIPWSAGLVIAVAAMFAATLAGLGPALYAVRQRIPETIAYE